jgi:hypothetical protein
MTKSQWIRLPGILLGIGALHSVAGFLLYRARVLDKHPALHSDFIVFGLPALGAFLLYCMAWRSAGVLSQRQAAARTAGILAIAAISVLFSFAISIILPFATYGT